MSTWTYILIVAVTMFAQFLLGQTEGLATGSPDAPSAVDTPQSQQQITFQVLGMMKAKSGAT